MDGSVNGLDNDGAQMAFTLPRRKKKHQRVRKKEIRLMKREMMWQYLVMFTTMTLSQQLHQ